MRCKREGIPWAMAAGRAALGPVLMLGAMAQWNGLAMAGMVVTALLSDIFDGVLARRWHCDTAAVRLFDSLADTVFYLGVGIALYLARPTVWTLHRGGFLAVLLAEVLNIGFACARYGRPASYHSSIAKTWGLVLATTVVTTFASGTGAAALWTLAIALGIASNAEGLIMSTLLAGWTHDVKHIGIAWRLRRQQTSAPAAILAPL